MGLPEQHLDSLPSMGAAFARALVPRKRAEGSMPRHQAVVRGITQDRERLAAYARVCGFSLRDAVPVTWLHVQTFPLHLHLLSDPASSVRLVGAVHVSNRMTLHRPVTAAEDLEIRVQTSELRPHKRGALVDLVGEIRVADETVWDGVSTYLATGVQVPGEPEATERPPVIDEPPFAQWRLPRDLGRRYRSVSGDPNPIHTSRLAARAFGFSRPIIHGMWTHARALAALEGRIPAAYTAAVDFLRPIALPSTVGFAARQDDGRIAAAVTSRDGDKAYLRMDVSEDPRGR